MSTLDNMHNDTLLRWSWSGILTWKRYELLKEKFGGMESAYEHLSADLLAALRCKPETITKVLKRLQAFDVREYRRELDRRGIVCLSHEDAAYPATLRTIDDPPLFLYVRGSLDCLRQPAIALVGTRTMSGYGKRVTEEIADVLLRERIVTVSGLAYGIDAHVARQTLAKGGSTIAVLGHGLGMVYPKAHEALAEEIVQKNGLLLSEFPLDTRPDTFTFPARNRIIAGLSMATVVLEAAEESGSLITADLALDYNREVFAVPGQIFDAQYAGCHALIAKGAAKLLYRAEDLLTDCGIVPSRKEEKSAYVPETEQEETVLASLSRMPINFDDLLEATTLDIATITATLTLLEMRGMVTCVGEGKWVRAA